MKQNNVAQLRELSIDELNEKVMELRKEQFVLRLKKSEGSLEKPHHIRELRRRIARIKTIQTEKAGANHE